MQQVNKPQKPMMFYYMVVLVILFLLNFLLFPQLLKPDVKEVDYGTFLSMVDKKEVSKVQIEERRIITRRRHLKTRIWWNAYMTLDARLTVSSKKR